MTVEADIYSALSALVTGRVFPHIAPPDTARPYITYQQIGGVAESYEEDVPVNLKNGRIQFDVWSNDFKLSAALMLDVEAALISSATFQARPVGANSSSYEVDTKLHGRQQDFSIWSVR